MKQFYRNLLFLIPLLVLGCQQNAPFTAVEKEAIQKEVKAQFLLLVDALNQKDAVEWSTFYSQGNYISSIVGVDSYADRAQWIETITNYFDMRETQHIEPMDINVTGLSPDLALLTSEEKTEMQLKTGETMRSKHVFTMVWKKEQGGWRILHSHESWVDEPTE